MSFVIVVYGADDATDRADSTSSTLRYDIVLSSKATEGISAKERCDCGLDLCV